MHPPLMTAPIAPFNNVPPQPEFYKPRRFDISGITLGRTTIVQTTLSMNYVIGQLVRLTIPIGFGCRQLNEKQAYVIDIPSNNQVELELDSSQDVDPFIIGTSTTLPQIIPIGDINLGAQNASGRSNTSTSIPGSFVNIS